jgi:hypothetical protein
MVRVPRLSVARGAKLPPPPPERGSYGALVTDASQLTELLGTLHSTLSTGGGPLPELLARGRELAARVVGLDRPLGMGVCSSPASPGA